MSPQKNTGCISGKVWGTANFWKILDSAVTMPREPQLPCEILSFLACFTGFLPELLTDDIRLPFSLGEKRKLRAAVRVGYYHDNPDCCDDLVPSLILCGVFRSISMQILYVSELIRAE